MDKILITGASGFVATNLQNYLKTSFEVVQLSIRFKPNQMVEISENAIIHLAGKAHDLKKVANPQEYYEANFELTKQLFDAFLVSKASVFIFISTVKAVADDVNGILAEDTVPNPKTHYGISKLQAENYILNQKIQEGKRIFILRPCMIHGPGNKGNLNLLYTIVKKGLPWPLGAFENQRSYCSIENLCFVIQQLLESETIPSGVYNVADDIALSTNELIQLMGESQIKPTRIFSISKGIIKAIAKTGDFLRLPLNSERLQKLTESYVVSNDKIVAAIGKSLPVSSIEGLMRTLKSFKV